MKLKASKNNYCPLFRKEQEKVCVAESDELNRRIQEAVKKNLPKLINSEQEASKTIVRQPIGVAKVLNEKYKVQLVLSALQFKKS